jgi:hypothetical protein
MMKVESLATKSLMMSFVMTKVIRHWLS